MSFGINFNGSGVNKKRLNFANDNDTVSSAARVRQLREERERRERERLRQMSSVAIQRVFRGHSARNEFRTRERAALVEAQSPSAVFLHGALYFRFGCCDADTELFRKFLLCLSDEGPTTPAVWQTTTAITCALDMIARGITVDPLRLLRARGFAPRSIENSALHALSVVCQQKTTDLCQELVLLCIESPRYITQVLSKTGCQASIPIHYAPSLLSRGAATDFQTIPPTDATAILGALLFCFEHSQNDVVAFLAVFRKVTCVVPASHLVADILQKDTLLHLFLTTKALDRIVAAIKSSSEIQIEELCAGLQKVMSYCCTTRETLLQTVSLVSRVAMCRGLIGFLWEHVKKRNFFARWDCSASVLFLDLYNYYLESVDDDRTFHAEDAVSASDVLVLISSLRDHIASQRSLQDCAAVNVLSRLHIIDERRPFCPPDTWAFPPNSTLLVTSTVASVSWEEYLAFDHTKASTKRSLYALRRIPFGIPFHRRASLFYMFMDAHAERVRTAMGATGHHPFHGISFIVNRRQLFEDGYQMFTRIGAAEIFDRSRVQFVNDDREMEAGFGDGVFKEFVVELCKDAFSVDHGLFKTTAELGLYPNPHSAQLVGPHHVEYFRFLGRLLGKAIYEKILVDIPLAKFFRNLILGRSNTFSDLAPFDPELHRNLQLLRNHDGDVETDFSLNFCVSETSIMHGTHEIPLIPNGRNISVTNENRTRYVLMAAHYKLNTQIRIQTDAFREGLSEVVPLPALQMFDSNELQTIFQGEEGDHALDISDWMAHTTYSGGYTHDHPTIVFFWDFVASLAPAQQRQLLKFTTSVPRAPLLGFKHLIPHFNIVKFGGDGDRLPSAATCMCTLKLPPYITARVLQEKVLYAITNTSGFELS